MREASHSIPAQLETLLRKHAGPGPRYTSYPTAPIWRSSIDGDAFAKELDLLAREAEQGDASPLALYVHLPFCSERCLFCGCNVVIGRKPRLAQEYLDHLLEEVELFRGPLGGLKVSQLHLGGGTPTYFTPPQLRQLNARLREAFDFAPDAEVAIEVDPAITGDEMLDALREMGFNRVSLGVQDLDPRVQEAVHRLQPTQLVDHVYRKCRDLGFHSVNMDLIYGLPFQTEQSFGQTLDQIVAWQPDRLAIYSYAHVPWIKPHQRKMPEDALPDETTRIRLQILTRQKLLASGFEAVGMDHYALPTDELAVARRSLRLHRNFMGYTVQPPGPVLAFGMSSISDLGSLYAQNDPKLVGYERAIDEGKFATVRGMRLSEDDLIRRDVIMDIMCNFVFDFDRIDGKHGIDSKAYFADELQRLADLEQDGLVERRERSVEVTTIGRMLVRNVAMTFDAYLGHENQGDRPIYSKTV